MATITKAPDGDLSLGNLRGEIVNLKPAANDYVLGGYLIQGVAGATEGSGNVGMAKVLVVIPLGSPGGFNPSWNPATGKLQVLTGPAALGGVDQEVAAGVNLSALTFPLLVLGL